ncbi:hypothetical protein FACS1894126_5970 [Alphaproteobacteria bacterium]|nr:hypothetical protein FACS1894126_5970 [Alphaproteobacteria bacterium]
MLSEGGIEDKESYRWLETMSKSAEGIPSDIKLLRVCDREGDMYELFEKASSTGQLFLIRVANNRLTTDNKKIIDEIKSRRHHGFMKVSVPRNSRTNTKARETILEVNYHSFKLKKPRALESNHELQEMVAVNVVYVREKSDDLSNEPIDKRRTAWP